MKYKNTYVREFKQLVQTIPEIEHLIQMTEPLKRSLVGSVDCSGGNGIREKSDHISK